MILLEVRIEIDLPEKLVEACKIGEETITEAYAAQFQSRTDC